MIKWRDLWMNSIILQAASDNKMGNNNKKCIICGCRDHRLVGCVKHKAKKCSCYQS